MGFISSPPQSFVFERVELIPVSVDYFSVWLAIIADVRNKPWLFFCHYPTPRQINSIQKYLLYILSFLGWWSYLLYKLFRLISFSHNVFTIAFLFIVWNSEKNCHYSIFGQISVPLLFWFCLFLEAFSSLPSRLWDFMIKYFCQFWQFFN